MEFSGILVAARPADVAGVADRLDTIPGVEVFVRHAASGRIVAVQEAADVEAHEALFRSILALPGVLGAELVYHVVDPGTEPAAAGADRPAEPRSRGAEIRAR